MRRVCCVISVVLLLAVLGLVYKFIIEGEVVESTDGRQALLLEPGERDLVLQEMRVFLQSVQSIIDAVAQQKPQQVVAAARQVGVAAQGDVPASLIKKLPLDFKRLGFDTHGKFDQLALDVEQFGEVDIVLPQLSELMQNCVACHSIYRIDPALASKSID